MGRVFKLQPYAPKPRYIPKIKKHEESIQKQVCSYLRLQYSHVIFRSDYASGLHLTINQATVHRSLQSGRAFPDLFIYEPSRGFHGMALELKKDGTTIILKTGPRKGLITSDTHIQEQAKVINDLRHKGYYADFAVGYDDAVKKIDWYFDNETRTMF